MILAAIVVVSSYWDPASTIKKPETPSRPAQTRTEKPKSRKKPGTTRPATSKRSATRTKSAVKIAIVIDDLGQSMGPAQELIALRSDITFSILPNLPHSEETALLAHKNKRDVLLHMPMERKNNSEKSEAAGTLRSDMTPMEFTTTIDLNIDSVPGAIGINNHEGSALTENSEAMKFLMAELKTRDLMFLDSLTAPKSLAYATARKFGIRTAKRDVFLDNYKDDGEYIRGQLEELTMKARERGNAIGIGHPYEETLAELKQWIPEVKKQGIEIVPVSELMK